MLLHALTIFVAAFLLFLVQPIIGKQILPWFGGTAAVWSTCLVFFNLALLAGYFYSDWTTRKLGVRRQVMLHLGLVAIALLLLPIMPDAAWRPGASPDGNEQPTLRILMLLTATIGLPYFLLSTTSPLVQASFVRAYPGASPYRLFALSNLASMLALVGYPFWVEPNITGRQQAIFWSVGFGVFALLVSLVMWRALKSDAAELAPVEQVGPERTSRAPTSTEKITWVALAALASSMLLGVSNHLTQNIASIPLLWVMPLALYLLTFILCFNARDQNDSGATSWYPRSISLPQTALAICAMAWLLADRKLDFMLLLHIVVFASGLFITCMYCHGELATRKPAPQYLTTFYLMISSGGALGACLIGIVAPLVLSAYYELSLVLYALAFLGTWLLWREAHWAWSAVGILVCAITLSAALYGMTEFRKGAVAMSRNFYGTLRVKDANSSNQEGRKRSLVHGAILHGDQYLDAARRATATTYYKTTSGIGLALLQKEKELARPRRVGIVGLGAGTIAVYGRKDDVFRFYEINPAVVAIAQRDFTYLKDSAASIEIAMGDARLNLERETPQRFDVLAIDAFSSDSIPVHLITVEALAVYERHMQPDGIIAFHVSNRFLQLQPVVAKLAVERGLSVAWIEEVRDDGATASDWVLVSKDRNALLQPDIVAATQPIPPKPQWRMWTDDFNNLVQVLK